MSPAMSALASVGVTHQILILAVLALVAAGVIGLFWHYILPGAIIIGVASLFYVAPEVTQNQIESAEIEVKVDEAFDEYQAYMQDCMEIANYPMLECKKLWNQRQEESHSENHGEVQKTSNVKLIETDNSEYKVRRAAALAKPNAIVIQETYR